LSPPEIDPRKSDFASIGQMCFHFKHNASMLRFSKVWTLKN
jgi:hypothetical protein